MNVTRDESWATIDVLKRRLDEAGFWDEDFLKSAIDEHKKAYIRRQIKTITDGEGWPLFANVLTVDAMTGVKEHVYKQETLFDRDDYMQVVGYHRDRAAYHEAMAAGYAGRAERRYAMQLPMSLVLNS